MKRDNEQCSCGYLVLLTEIGPHIGGYDVNGVVEWATKYGLPIVRDWAGREAVRPADAAALVERRNREQAEHDSKWQQYLRHIEEERKRKADERIAAARKARRAAEDEELR
jgi:hypothetical protein